jgi:hypothetical protein
MFTRNFFLHTALILSFAPQLYANDPSVGGKYTDLITKFECAKDQAQYGSYNDYGKEKAYNQYCGAKAPAGYWVYVAPHWYVWKNKAQLSDAQKQEMARVHGKYSNLITKISVPEDETSDSIREYGYYKAHRYKGNNMPAGYYAYVAPHWYIWKDVNLDAAGFARMEKSVQLQKGPVTVYIEFKKGNEAWAAQSLDAVARGLVFLEKFTGIAYPGSNPYPILEQPILQGLGRANNERMVIASPPKGSLWTQMHEIVHIWNSGVSPKWICEGLANFLSILLMREFNLPYVEGDTYASWQRSWHQDRAAGKDKPMNDPKDQYDEVAQGKAMEFWPIVYEVAGPNLIQAIFKAAYAEKNLSNTRAMAIMKQHGISDPAKLLSGWVTRGPYKVNRAADLGAVAYPLSDLTGSQSTANAAPVAAPTTTPAVSSGAVWAMWNKGKWYRGKITGSCAKGQQVAFDDGDQKCCAKSEIIPDAPPAASAVKTGSRVIAQWKDGKFYMGKIAGASGHTYLVRYDDGESGEVALDQLRLLPR